METQYIVRCDYKSSYLFFKRCFDLIFALIAIIFLFIPLLVIALAVKFTSPGPVFFRQTRIGYRGKLFKIIKFRSMIDGADSMKASLQKQNEVAGPHFKIENDPRVTPIGYFIRKYGFDELPQLWNILCGDMSFVGPRPAIITEVDQYEPWHMQRFEAIPGLTCFWQVNQIDKIKMSFDEWVNSDISYINNRSMLLDMILIFQTIRVFFKGH